MSGDDLLLHPIGRISTPYGSEEECPSNIDPSVPVCTLELEPAYGEGLRDLEVGDMILVLYWLGSADRGRVLQQRRGAGPLRGTFSLRSPHRPNPIGAAVVRIDGIRDRSVTVRGMDCMDGTPLLDIKPAMTV